MLYVCVLWHGGAFFYLHHSWQRKKRCWSVVKSVVMRADKSRPVPISYTWQNFLLRWDNMEDIIELGSSHVFFQHHMCVQLNQIFPPFFPLFSMGALSHFFSLKAVSSLSFPTGFVVKAPFLIMTENISAATWDEKSILSVENQSGGDKRCYTHTKKKNHYSRRISFDNNL